MQKNVRWALICPTNSFRAEFRGETQSNYWRTGLPKAPCVELSGITETAARAAARRKRTGRPAYFYGACRDGDAQRRPQHCHLEIPGGSVMTLSMWVDTPPFDNPKVRQAMKLVVDRQKMVETALLGLAARQRQSRATDVARRLPQRHHPARRCEGQSSYSRARLSERI